jgi:poly(glycerol-phosphate) alpha-glucosyltransferase
MLEPWALRNSGWKKRLALLLYERKCLDRAACIQVNSEAELRSVRAFGLKNPVCVIPNGIDLPELNGTQGVGREAQVVGRKTLLYLGRIHPKKGLVNLLKAWRMALGASGTVGDGWVLAIAGWDQGGHEKELRILSAECGIEKSVAFLGPQFGEDKAKCYRDCDAVVLPSFSEGLPMAVLEAWSYGKPVLMTPECNLPEGFAAGAALRIESNPQSIARELQELFSAPRALRLTLGRNGRALVASRFTWQKVAREMSAVYEWVLGDTARPGCVVG